MKMSEPLIKLIYMILLTLIYQRNQKNQVNCEALLNTYENKQ
jgi:hypothetical protein